MKDIHAKLHAQLASFPGRCGLVIVNLANGEKWEYCPETCFAAASMIKLPLMYEVMRQAAAGLLSLDEYLTVTSEIQTGGAGILGELLPGLQLTIRELVTLMIILSDNTATNMLIDRIGMDSVNNTAAALGLQSTILRRRMMDFEAAARGEENMTSAADLAQLFAHIYHPQLLSKEYGALMLDILKRQQVRDKLPFYLPEEIKIAHKTGTLPGVEHDGGILFLSAPYIICVLTDGHTANYEGLQLVALIGKIIYEMLIQKEDA
ncbi:serine hydrolase [Anaerospora hongkongensis]|uniref:serine hydrolase n=1 Tax=Anaerospora hongkongensis TaxID=244830 RepID=UPI00289C6B13|nr:serine hydrolase [Anaerospora hongkongensis]